MERYYDDDDDGDDDAVAGVLLGFLEPQESRQALLRRRFPSKAGGRPAWLNPRDLPSAEQLHCGRCERPLRFLLQIYAPDDDDEVAFHRSLFLFCCEDGACADSADSVKVFRSQLRRHNEFYAAFPEDDRDDAICEQNDGYDFANDTPYPSVSLCSVCGVPSNKTCSSCRKTFYCSRLHQKRHWKAQHSSECRELAESALDQSDLSVSKLLYPQFEILIEPEPEPEDHQYKSEKELLRQYENEVKTLNNTDQKELNELNFENRIELDDEFIVFQNRMQRAPSQCIRYKRSSEVLWTHGKDRLEDVDGLRCSECGGAVDFEFQVLPQLLSYLRVDEFGSGKAMDFGTIAVYTCRTNCGDGEHAYMREIAFRQAPTAPM